MNKDKSISAESLMKRYNMEPHAENGCFVERHYEADPSKRAASGLIYYYVAPREITEFHRIDCDEYWCYTEGAPLLICTVDESGNVSTAKFGIEDDCEPVVYFPKGVIFASKSLSDEEGTFLSCITVPRFSPAGFELFGRAEITAEYPETKSFFEGSPAHE